jgi:N-methylhydantoinase A
LFRISIDQGGTFADGVLVDDKQTLTVAKVETDSAEPSKSIMRCLGLLAEERDMTLRQLLGDTSTISICTTLGTNAILEGKGAKCCLFHTDGFRDVFELGRTMPKEDIYNLKVPAPKVLIPRYLRFGIGERIDYRGEVITPLNEDDVRTAVAKAKQQGVEIPVIGFLHSYINPVHEEQAADIVKEDFPDVVVSSRILRRWIEYDRISTATMAAYVKPRFTRFVQTLEERLEADGFQGALLFGTAMGDITTARLAVENPANIIASGVVNGALMARFLAEHCGFKNVVSIDMGGTSADIAVLADRMLPTTTDTVIGDQKNAVESIDTTSIGAGGGSIARIDRLNVVRVGPESVGANPGPSCFGKGGESAAVTDADVVLGYIPTDNFLGGAIRGDAGLAEKAINEKIAEPLGIDVVEAANTIVSLAEASMSERVFLSVVEKGHDPRDFVLVSGGGAGPVHAAAIAKRLGIERVYIPKHAAVLSALGGMAADYGYVLTRFFHRRDDLVELVEMGNLYGSMEEEATGIFANQGINTEDMLVVRGAEMRYLGQLRDLSINLPETSLGTPLTAGSMAQLISTFHERHQAMFGWGDPSLPVVIGLLKLRAVAKRQPLSLTKGRKVGNDPSGAFKRHRRAYFKDAGGFVQETPCYDGGAIAPGNVITGPSIIEEPTTTVVIPPGWVAEVDAYRNYSLTAIPGGGR